MEALDPWEITPLHEVRSKRQLRRLVSAMRAEGWNGLPLLVISTKDQYIAWTGSHRIAAARVVGFNSVPCYVIDESLLIPLGVDANTGHVDDSDRLEIVRRLRDPDALRIMWQESRSN